MIRSPLRYPGGKSRVVKLIENLAPDFEEFREPFLGGGSVFVYFKQKFSNKIYWINDNCEALYCFWKKTQQYPTDLLQRIQECKDKFELEFGKDLYDHVENLISFPGGWDLSRAVAFFILNRITFSGLGEYGGFSKAAFKGRFTQSSIDRIQLLSTILTNTKITNLDYREVLQTKGKNVFIYLDPPYYSNKKLALYGRSHKKFNHEEFAKILKTVNHKWLITYDNSDYIRGLFSFANIQEYRLTYGMRNVGQTHQKETELFIRNY